MSYNKGTEDDLVHAKFHKASVGGIDYPVSCVVVQMNTRYWMLIHII